LPVENLVTDRLINDLPDKFAVEIVSNTIESLSVVYKLIKTKHIIREKILVYVIYVNNRNLYLLCSFIGGVLDSSREQLLRLS